MSILCQFCRDAKKRHIDQACSPRSVHKPDRFFCLLPEWTWIEHVKLRISAENATSRKTVVFGGASGGRSRWLFEILRGSDPKVWPNWSFLSEHSSDSLHWLPDGPKQTDETLGCSPGLIHPGERTGYLVSNDLFSQYRWLDHLDDHSHAQKPRQQIGGNSRFSNGFGPSL